MIYNTRDIQLRPIFGMLMRHKISEETQFKIMDTRSHKQQNTVPRIVGGILQSGISKRTSLRGQVCKSYTLPTLEKDFFINVNPNKQVDLSSINLKRKEDLCEHLELYMRELDDTEPEGGYIENHLWIPVQ